MANKINMPESEEYILIDEDRIPIYTGEHDDHSYMWYGISDGNSGEVNFKVHISIDEDDSAFLLEDFFARYFDAKYNQDIYMPTDEFEHWGDNFYPLSVVKQILQELEELVILLEGNPHSSRIHEIIDLNRAIKAYRNISLRICFDDTIPLEEKLIYMFPKKAVLIDFYSRFIYYVRKMIDENQNAEFFVVSGP